MPFAARLGVGASKSIAAEDGLNELAKGAFQIWRFLSHTDAGVTAGPQRHTAPVGVVVTLDPWMTMSHGVYSDVMGRAKRLAREKEPEMSLEDLCPIAFCPVEELELTLQSATHASLIQSLLRAATAEGAGWHLSKLHEEGVEVAGPTRSYPFETELPKVLPWWGDLKERGGA